jgi:hypothetical protein
MLHHMATILVCYGGHFESNKKILRFGRNLVSKEIMMLRIDTIVGLLWRPFGIQMVAKMQKSSDLEEI